MTYIGFNYHLLMPREDMTTSGGSRDGGEIPYDSQGAENFDDEQKILADQDESSTSHMGSGSDPTGMVGPSHGMIETQDLSEEFLDGRVDLVEQMQKTADAISDAYEGELRDGPETEASLEI